MFDNLGNLPLHPLVVHAVVIGIPLAALLAFLFAFPKTRSWARWPLAITVIGATGRPMSPGRAVWRWRRLSAFSPETPWAT